MRTRWRAGAVIGDLMAAAASMAAALTGVHMATPSRGPGNARSHGVTLPDSGPTAVGAITHATLDRKMHGPFDDRTRRMVASLPLQAHHVGFGVPIRLPGNEVWTMTVWKDDAALEAYRSLPVHRTAIREGIAAVKTAPFLRFEWPAGEVPPPRPELMRRLESAEVIDYTRMRSGPARGYE